MLNSLSTLAKRTAVGVRKILTIVQTKDIPRSVGLASDNVTIEEVYGDTWPIPYDYCNTPDVNSLSLGFC